MRVLIITIALALGACAMRPNVAPWIDEDPGLPSKAEACTERAGAAGCQPLEVEATE